MIKQLKAGIERTLAVNNSLMFSSRKFKTRVNKKEDVMKTEGMQTLLQIEKEELKKLIAEVRETVAALINLPSEKKVSFETAALWNGRRNAA